jgi:hypothetical protein
MTVVREYREAIRGFGAMRNLEIWYSRLGVERIMQEIEAEEGQRAIKKAKKAEAKARAKDSLRALGRLSKMVDGELRFVGDPPLVVPLDDLLEGKQREEAEAGLQGVLDAVWIVLLTGRDDEDGLVLQAKEARPRCSSPTRAPAASATMAGGWSRASA